MKTISSKIQKLAIVFSMAFATLNSTAQDVHFSQFNGAPLTLNPALTGATNGMWRANGIYRNQWNSVTSPFVTFGASIDAPLFRGVGESSYFAGGLQLYNDRAGDGNLTNMSTLASIAYHKGLGENENMVLSVGMQGGFTQKSVDLARLYFADQFTNGGFQPGTTGENLNPKVQYWTANAGLGWQHAINEKISYQLGVAGHNLNQPQESLLKKRNNEVGLGMRINAYAGAIWWATDKLSIRPAVLYQTQSTATEIITGSEFNYIIGNSDIKSVAPAVFIGAYTRLGDAMLGVVGFEYNSFRLGLAYDYNISPLKSASNGRGGFELTFSYVRPNPLDFAKKMTFPCSRF